MAKEAPLMGGTGPRSDGVPALLLWAGADLC